MDDRNYRFTSSFVAALAELGIAHAVVAPGSRNTPLSMTLAAEGRITDWPHHDERSGAFFALGVGKASGRPALVTCTSGTAAAELHPAVVEARYGRVPLIVVTADRPSDLWEAGAAQTIDQRRIYGSAPLWSHDLDVPAPGDASPGLPAALAARLVAESIRGRGPVHLNLRFREPLVPTGPIPAPEGPVPLIDLGEARVGDGTIASLAAMVAGRRGVVVAGPSAGGRLPEAIGTVAARLGFPILPDPQSGVPSDHDLAVAPADALIAAGILDRLIPEVVVRIGPPPVSKALGAWLAGHPGVPQIHLDEDGWRDPGSSVARAVRADPAAVLKALGEAGAAPAPADWTDAWRTAGRIAGMAIADVVAGLPFPNEPAVAAAVGAALPPGALLYVASSMPIRDVALTFASTAPSARIVSNRGANGIDGFLSSTFGAAASWDGPVVALGGDLSALHDLTALATAARLGIPATVVIVDNDGGGIFHFLPQAGFPDVFERHFGTPHGVDLVGAALALGAAAEEVTDAGRIADAVADRPDGPRVLVVRTDRRANVGVHERIAAAVRAAAGL